MANLPIAAALIIALAVDVAQTARILCLVPLPVRSHWIVMEPLFQELASRGHQVTVYSPFPQNPPLANYTDIDFTKQLPPLTSTFTWDFIKNSVRGPWKAVFFTNRIHEPSCKVLKDPALQELWRTKEQYDLLITEVFGSDCFAYFAHKLNIPLISFTTSMSMPWGADRVGLPDNPSYIPNYLVNLSPNMDLWGRLYNTLTLVHAKFWHQLVFARNTRLLAEESLGEPLPPVGEVVAKTAVIFVNSYHTLAQSRPFPPTVVEVGGIHIKKRQPLPKDLQTLLDNAKHGSIIMSFGSLVRASSIPKPIIDMFMAALSKVPQTVIFKYEEDLPDAPPNVHVRKWIPQRDLIEHENVVALIVHGGLSSTIEVVEFGKPIIGIPFFVDQAVNLQAIVRKGAGIQLSLDNLSLQNISEALTEILYNPKYRENMERLSRQFRDRPLTALQTAVYWTEYVIRHRGASHLRPSSVDLPLYQYLLIDVVALLLLSVSVSLYVIYYCSSWVLRKVLNRTSKNHKSTRGNKKTD